MECHERSHGESLNSRVCGPTLSWNIKHLFIKSAEVVVQMIVAELTGKEWTHPPWLPNGYLTWNRLKSNN